MRVRKTFGQIAPFNVDLRVCGQRITAAMDGDELVFEVEASDVAPLRTMVVQEMEAAATLRVPLVVDCGVGDNWDEAH